MPPEITTTEPSREKLRLDAIDGLRAIAALWVMCFHIWVRIIPSSMTSARGWWLIPLGWCRYGHFAVDFFIVISGFCLMLPVLKAGGSLRGGPFAFFKKRARRILPTYYAAMLLTLPLCWLFVDWSRRFVTVKGVLLHALLLHDIFGNNEINIVYWSIAVECHIYLLFPLLVWLYRRTGAVGTILASSFTGTALYFVLKDTLFIGCTPQYLILFTLGMLAAKFCTQSQGQAARKVGMCAAVMSVGLIGLCGTDEIGHLQAYLGDLAPFVLDCCVGLCAMAVVVASAQSGTLICRLLSLRPLVLIGGFSYSLYLVHSPILYICLKSMWLPLRLHASLGACTALFLLLSLPITLAGSLAFYLLFEAPFLAAGSGGALEDFSRKVRAHSPLLTGIDRLAARWTKQPASGNAGTPTTA